MGLISVLLEMGLLALGAVITPGTGIAGHLTALLSQAITTCSYAPAYGVLTWLLTSGLRGYGWPSNAAVCLGVPVALIVGLWMEFV
jgi:hypothetical protein